MRIGHAIESLRGLRLLWVWLSPVLRRLFRLLPLVSQPAFGQQVGKAVQKGLEPFWGVAQGFLMGLLGQPTLHLVQASSADLILSQTRSATTLHRTSNIGPPVCHVRLRLTDIRTVA